MPQTIFHVDDSDAQQRIDLYLSKQWGGDVSRTAVQRLIAGGNVTVNQRPVKANYRIRAGDEVTVRAEETVLSPGGIRPENIPLNIFYEDRALLIIYKPAGLVVHPAQGCLSGTLVNALLFYCQRTGQSLSDVNTEERPGIVHRLDKETSGLLVVAKSNTYHVRLARQFEKHKVRKYYLALVQGWVAFDEGVVDVPIGRHPVHRDKKAVTSDEGGRAARTYYRVLKRFKNPVTYLELSPQSGRTHQLRVHMAHLGHPILGDTKYGDPRTFPRLALHARFLGFFHPETKKWVEFSCPAPPEFSREDLIGAANA